MRNLLIGVLVMSLFVSGGILNAKEDPLLGKVEELTLENGFKVIVKEDPKLPLVAFQLWVKAGSFFERDREAGITHLIEHMIFKGTERYPKGQVAKKIEAIGGHINAYTSFDHTVYHLEVPKSGSKDALDILLDAVLRPLFDPNELELEREVVLEEYRRALDKPEMVLGWDFLRLCFDEHPYGRPIIGYESSIRTISRELVLEYMKRYYVPNNMFLVACGDITLKEIEDDVKNAFKDLKESVKSAHDVTYNMESNKSFKVINKDVNQAYMELGWHTVPITHEDTPTLEVLEAILGNGKSSRLYENLRTKKRLVNSISVGNMSLKEAGLFTIYATLEVQDIKDALDEILRQIGLMWRGEFGDEEIESAKRKLELQTLSDLEGVSGQARNIGFFESYFGSYRGFYDYIARLKRVTRQDILTVTQRYLSPKAMKLALLLPNGVSVDLGPLSQLKEKIASGKEDKKTELLRLKNGIRIIVQERRELPIANLAVVLPGGLLAEEREINGISQVAARMLLRGTKDKNGEEVLRQIESYGARIETFSGRNSLGITIKCLSKDIDKLVSILREIISQPAFPQDEIVKVKQDMLNVIKAKKDRPFEIAMEALIQRLFEHYPYGMPEHGSEKTIQNITREKLSSWYNTLLDPQGMVISIVGDVDSNEILSIMEQEFGNIKPVTRPKRYLKKPELNKTIITNIPNQLFQTHIMVGFLDVSFKEEDNPAISVVNTILSRQGGRLFRILRDEMGLAYVVTSFRFNGPDTGAFVIYMACEPSKVAKAKYEILNILKGIQEKGATEEEIEEAKSFLLGSMLMEEQYLGQVALKMALDELFDLGYDHRERVKEKIKGITRDDIRRVSQKIFSNPYVFVTVGPN